MRALQSLLFLLCFVPACVAQAPAPSQYEGLPGVAIYSNGYLLSWDPQYTELAVYGRDAKQAFSTPDRTGDSTLMMWAVDSDGVVAGGYRARQVAEGRIDLRDRVGNLIGSIDTGSYIPQQVAFAPDHTIWAVCYLAGQGGTQDFKVLHHYARSGEELGQALSWSELGGDLKHPVIENIRGSQLLYVSNDRIGWNAALHPGSRTWIEVSFSGDLLGKYDVRTADGLAVWPSAMTASGNVYARISRPRRSRFAVLDRSKGVWQEVAGNPGGLLLGSEGDNLVFAQIQGSSATLNFTASSSLRAEAPQ
jgi:hypothetical protein